MGRIAIMPQRWEQNGLYLYRHQANEYFQINPNNYHNVSLAAALIFGGLPIFSNGSLQFTGEIIDPARWTLLYFGVRLPKTATLNEFSRFVQGYTIGTNRSPNTGLTTGVIYRDAAGILATTGVPNLLNYNCYVYCSGNRLTIRMGDVEGTVTDPTHTSGHTGVIVQNGIMYYPAIDFDGANPVWPTTSIAYLRFRVMRNNNPVAGAKVVAVHHKIADMTISNGDYPLPVLDKIGIAQGITGADGWVEIPLDTDDGPWIVSVAHHDGQTWCTAEGKPAEMPTLYV